MSLINDALKRAGQNTGRPAAPPPPVPVAMCPVERVSSRRLPYFVLPVAIVIFCAALVILIKGLSGGEPINAVARPPVVNARTPVAAAPQPATRTAPPSTPATSPVAVPVRSAGAAVSTPARTQPVSLRPATTPTSSVPASIAARPATAPATAAPPAVRAVAATAPAPQTYKLGGIFYRASNPSAVVNNRAVSIGERIGNARVKAITRDTVVLEFPGGQLLELTL